MLMFHCQTECICLIAALSTVPIETNSPVDTRLSADYLLRIDASGTAVRADCIQITQTQ